jgi:hypothetical protein
VAVDVANGVAVDVDAVDDLVDSEQATSVNMIVTTSSVVPQRITRDRCAGSCVNRERVQSAARILLLRLRDPLLHNRYRYLEPPRRVRLAPTSRASVDGRLSARLIHAVESICAARRGRRTSDRRSRSPFEAAAYPHRLRSVLDPRWYVAVPLSVVMTFRRETRCRATYLPDG